MKVSKFKQCLLSGVSYAIPFVASGGILIALSIALAPMTSHGPDFSRAPFLKLINDIGTVAFSLLIPVLSGYIAFGIADRPGLVPGFVGGYIANQAGSGFLGGLISGLLAGFVVFYLKKIKVPPYIRPVMPILVYPVISSFIVGIIMYKIIGAPIHDLMTSITNWLQVMNTGNKIILAIILGSMIAFDMGGPVNKVAFFFGAAMIQQGNHFIMGACTAAICIPPLGLGLATLLNKKLWTEQERDAGLAALAMGAIGITEGAIPFAAADPFRVIPVIMAGSSVGSVIAMLGKVGDHAPHGGPIVLPVVDNRLMYVQHPETGRFPLELGLAGGLEGGNLARNRQPPLTPGRGHGKLKVSDMSEIDSDPADVPLAKEERSLDCRIFSNFSFHSSLFLLTSDDA